MAEMISVIVPFYKGNRYMDELLENLDKVSVAAEAFDGTNMEVVIVNDSPEIPVVYSAQVNIPVTVVENEKNLGIHGSRIHGIRCAKGSWIQLLDQDDLLIPENYHLHIAAAKNCDVVVSNCLYYFGENSQLLYANRAVLEYYIAEKRFLRIRNMIASPGHCLIRKEAIPEAWLEQPMRVNGSDDYFLWLLMFQSGARFGLNALPVYIHRNSEEGNLSFDLEKMHRSSEEMCALLEKTQTYDKKKLKQLRRAVWFKFLYDTKKLKSDDWLRYADKVVENGIYKVVARLLQIQSR